MLKFLRTVVGRVSATSRDASAVQVLTGCTRRMGAWIRDTAVADLWVMDDQVNFVDDFKPMAEQRLQRVRGIDGVAWAVPMFKNYLSVQLPDGTRVLCRIVGLDDASLVGGPPK